jgi:hypothetical protein
MNAASARGCGGEWKNQGLVPKTPRRTWGRPVAVYLLVLLAGRPSPG